MSPLESAILAENMQDLHQRMEQFNSNALEVARFLEDHEKVAKVYYSMLPSHGSHKVAEKILRGGSSVVSFNLKENTMDGLQRFYDTDMPHIPKAPTLGSNKTLICPYTLLTHYTETDEYLDFIGLSRYLVRVAVGCEDDLAPIISDLEAALENV
jgi:cystathionine beta-lyase/cystathionine gamma-synthase